VRRGGGAASPTRGLARGILGPACDHVLLLRPRQWPILTFQLAVGVLAAPRLGASSPSGGPAPLSLALAWVAWVVCLNGGTLAYNSAYDRDQEDVAYLRDPPSPPRGMAPIALGLMLTGIPVAWLVAPALAWLVAGCTVLSVLYSHPWTRWKGVPGLDLAVNMVGYGGGTTLAGLVTGQAACGPPPHGPDAAGGWLIAGFALLFGSFYPMTQLYQLASDRRRGDRTLATALGPRRSLTLAVGLGLGATACFAVTVHLWRAGRILPTAVWPLLALVLWLGHALLWRRRAALLSAPEHERRMYRALLLWTLVDLSLLAARHLP
jgi:4-hydroxybenzoate polyprenyltransferase